MNGVSLSPRLGVVVQGGDHACVVVSSKDLAVLGGLLVWLDRRGLTTVAMVVEHHAGIHARRASVLAAEVEVWELTDGNVVAAVVSPIPPAAQPPIDVADLVVLIERSGAQVVLEGGVIRAEVEGLEVGRVVIGAAGPELEVGIGRFDREAGVLLHGGRPTRSTLVETVAMISEHRRPGAPAHALNRIGRERWLREWVRTDPLIVGVDSSELVEPIRREQVCSSPGLPACSPSPGRRGC